MSERPSFARKLILIAVLLLVLLLLRPGKTAENGIEQTVDVLAPSIFVNESALFHPLIRQGTFNPLVDRTLESLKAYLAVNADSGEVYTARNATDRVSPASLVKLMTAMVALDVAFPTAQLTASGRAAAQEPTLLGVKPGEVFTLQEMVPAMIATSANDAATIVGEEVLRGYGGNEQVFIALMNRKAEALGLGDTRFTNTQGFDDPLQYSNAYDLTRIAQYAYRNYPMIRNAAAIPYTTIEKTNDHGFYHLPNWNALLGTYTGVNGLKIGFTEQSKHSTIVTAAREGTTVIVVIVGAESIIERDLSAARLLNIAFSHEELSSVAVSESLIEPRIDEWRDLREQILTELEKEK